MERLQIEQPTILPEEKSPGEIEDIIKTQLGRKLAAIRRKAIANGLELLEEDEILRERALRNCTLSDADQEGGELSIQPSPTDV